MSLEGMMMHLQQNGFMQIFFCMNRREGHFLLLSLIWQFHQIVHKFGAFLQELRMHLLFQVQLSIGIIPKSNEILL